MPRRSSTPTWGCPCTGDGGRRSRRWSWSGRRWRWIRGCAARRSSPLSCKALGDVEKAKTLLRKAIGRDPEFDTAKRELSRLKRGPAEQKKGFLDRLLKK